MMAWLEGLQLVGIGVLLYALAWVLWRCCLAPARQYDAGAEKRAQALLAELLSERERLQLAESGYLVVRSPALAGRSYRIPAMEGWVDVYDAGALAMKLCIQPSEGLPAGDVVLMHKLMIESSEPEYLRLANVRWMRPNGGWVRFGKGV